jgi:nucleoside-diphosphate-sugar epimerase
MSTLALARDGGRDGREGSARRASRANKQTQRDRAESHGRDPRPELGSAVRGFKVLVTGAAGQIGFPLSEDLARQNEVWGVDLFDQPGSRKRLHDVGVRTRVLDLERGSFDSLPEDFDYVLHLAAYISTIEDYDRALRVNAEGTGLLLSHCRRARAALIMSTSAAYGDNPDPLHRFVETDPLGGRKSVYSPTYGISKIAEEAVARTSARLLGLPVVIARMSTAYGVNGGLPASHLDSIVEDQEITIRGEGTAYNPISQKDINEQLGSILGAATVPATVVNWGGDEVVTDAEWCEFLATLVGRPSRIHAVDGAGKGGALDVSRRAALTGACGMTWQEGMREMFEHRYPEGADGPRRSGVRGAHALEASVQRYRSGDG